MWRYLGGDKRRLCLQCCLESEMVQVKVLEKVQGKVLEKVQGKVLEKELEWWWYQR